MYRKVAGYDPPLGYDPLLGFHRSHKLLLWDCRFGLRPPTSFFMKSVNDPRGRNSRVYGIIETDNIDQQNK